MRLCVLALTSSLFFAMSVPALADDVFTLTNGTDTIIFNLPASPVAPETNMECGRDPGFCFYGIPFTVNNVQEGGDFYFFPGGGLSIDYGSVLDGNGPPLFTGNPLAPTFIPGTFNIYGASYLTSTEFTGPFTLTIAAATPTPEPSTLVLLGSGLLGTAGILRRRLFHAR